MTREISISRELCTYLSAYIDERQRTNPVYSDAFALFTNRFHSRLSERSIQRMVKKYTVPQITNGKNLTARSFVTG